MYKYEKSQEDYLTEITYMFCMYLNAFFLPWQDKNRKKKKIIVKIMRIFVANFMFLDLHTSPKMLDFKLCKRKYSF